MPEKRKTVFLIDFHPFVTRNVLDSGVLEKMVAVCDVVLLVIEHKKEYFEEVYGHMENLTIEGVPFEHISSERMNVRFERVADLLLDTNVKKYHKMERRDKTGAQVRYVIETLFTKTVGKCPPLRTFIRWLDGRLTQAEGYDALFEKYKPDAVFVTDVFDGANALMINRARHFGVRAVGMTRSWDNTTTKTYLRAVPDVLLTQNEFMKEELARLHDVEESAIEPVGVPQFDEYLSYTPGSREAFCAEMGLDPTKRIVLVCPASGVFVDTDWQILEALKELYEKGEIPNDVQFLVRPHPYNDTDYGKFAPHPAFVFESRLITYQSARWKEREEGRANRRHLTETLFHIDLMINTFSSIILDAIICDKPVISIGFDGREKNVPFHRSLARWQTEECVIYFFSRNATPVVQSEEELKDWLLTYLRHPETHRAERKRFAESHMWRQDGKSAERIVNAVTNQSYER